MKKFWYHIFILTIGITVFVREEQFLRGQTNMNKTPSAIEFNGLYNIDPIALKRQGDYPLPENCLTVTPGLSRPSFKESCDIYDLIIEYARSQSIDEETLYCEPKSDDRTVYLTFRNLNDLNLQNLNGLMHLLRTRSRDWRVAVIGISPETTIIVYPSRIAFPREGEEHEVLEAIKNELETHHDRTYGSLERQKAWVERLLNQNPVSNYDVNEAPRVIAVFDNYRGCDESFCIWLMNGNGKDKVNWWPPDDRAVGISIGSEKIEIVKSTGNGVQSGNEVSEFIGVVEPVVLEKTHYTGKVEFRSSWIGEKHLRRVEGIQKSTELEGRHVTVDLTKFKVITHNELKEWLGKSKKEWGELEDRGIKGTGEDKGEKERGRSQ
jgi:hypothetical protein